VGDYTRRIFEVPDCEPYESVEDVMQTERKQKPVKRSIYKNTGGAVFDHPVAAAGDTILNGRPQKTEDEAHSENSQRSNDRHEPTSAEELKVIGSLISLNLRYRAAAVAPTSIPAKTPMLISGLSPSCHANGFSQERRHICEDSGKNKITYDRRESRNAGAVGKADRHANREQHG